MDKYQNPLNPCAMLVLGAALLIGSLTAYAEDVPKGVTVVRGDAYGAAANEADNYKKETTNLNDQLEDVSALCGKKPRDTAAALVATDQSRVWGHHMSAKSTTLIKAGGRIAYTPMPNNPNHCSIRGLTINQLKGVWR